MNFRMIYISEKIPKYFEAAIKEYEKRLTRYCKLKRIGVKNEEMLIKSIPQNSYVVLISPQGEAITSETMAEKIKHYGVTGNSDVTFVLGEMPVEANEHLSISQMDMDQGLQLVVLVEQLYRGYRILNGEPYHK